MLKTLDFGEKLPSASDIYIRVKEKGDSVTFRIAQKPVYTAKHFMKDSEGKWDVTECSRVMSGDECAICIEFFKLKAKAKKIKDIDKKAFAELENKAGNFRPSTQFFFPILNRGTEEFAVLQVTQGVKNKLDEFYAAGTKVYDRDFVLKNTGGIGRDRYALTVVDSADSKKLSEKEIAGYDTAKVFDMSSIADGSSEEEDE